MLNNFALINKVPGAILFEELPEVNPQHKESPEHAKGSSYSLLSSHKHYHTHNHQTPPATKLNIWRGTGFVFGVLTLGIAFGTFHYTRMQGLETMRQNDLSEVEQGLLTKEEYLSRWGKRKKHPNIKNKYLNTYV